MNIKHWISKTENAGMLNGSGCLWKEKQNHNFRNKLTFFSFNKGSPTWKGFWFASLRFAAFSVFGGNIYVLFIDLSKEMHFIFTVYLFPVSAPWPFTLMISNSLSSWVYWYLVTFHGHINSSLHTLSCLPCPYVAWAVPLCPCALWKKK